MGKEEKKSDRIPTTTKTRLRLKKYYVNQELRNYDEAINILLDNIEK
jgi:hypothetical protein